MRNRPIYDVVALLARCGVGTVFVAHGWQKIQVGINATGRNLDAMGAPFPTAAAVYSTFVELLGGAALILGLALPAAGLLLFVDMIGALIFVHAKHGIFLVDNARVNNGFELVLVLGLAALVFAAGGAGRLTLDQRLFARRETAPDEAEDVPPWRPTEETTTPALAAGEFPARPEEDPPAPSSRPRLAAEMVTDTSRDVIVAGKKKTEPPADDDTTVVRPARTRKKPPKPDA
jgi:putative oxidoreductase